MFHTATLTAHRGATLVSREELATYEPPEPEGRWKPVKHSLIVDLMHEELDRREITRHERGICDPARRELPVCGVDVELARNRGVCRFNRLLAFERQKRGDEDVRRSQRIRVRQYGFIRR